MNKKYLLIGAAVVVLLIVTVKSPLVGLLAIAGLLAAYAMFGMRDAEPPAPQFPRPERAPVPEFIPHNEAPPPAPVVFTAEPGPGQEVQTAEKPSDIADPYSPPVPVPVAPWHAPILSFMTRLAPWCGDVIVKLAGRTFEPDPILTAEQTRFAGVINSAVAQHGKLIEKAILECLQEKENFAAWDEPDFWFSHGDTSYHKGATLAGAALAQLPYGDGHAPHYTFAVDLIVYDKAAKIVRAYEIKRKGSDQVSAEKLRIVRSLLLSYARDFKKLDVTGAEVWTVHYYGHRGGLFKLTSADLDAHFGCPVFESVETASRAFCNDLQNVLNPPAMRAAA